LQVLNDSSGQNTATLDKFPHHVLTESYSSGFTNSLMAKDLQLYVDAVVGASTPSTLGSVTTALWARFAAEEPGADFTRIYPFVKHGPS
jgi:3-hydroxyisobutyrate dehydrogenase-like beta-hydroxyacid dehydrogenase